MESNLHDKPIEKDIEKLKYKQAVSEYKIWHSLITTVVGRSITVLNFKKDNVLSEYGEILNAPKISNGIDEIDYVWNESNHEKFPDKNVVNITTVYLLVMIEV